MEYKTMDIEKEKSDMRMHIVESHLEDFPHHLSISLPPLLEDLYGGTLDFVVSPEAFSERPIVFVNFVMSKEGIFNLKDQPGGGPISQGNRADALTMAILRSIAADGVMVGASTLRSEPEHLWTADFIFDVFGHMKGLVSLKKQFRQWRRDVKGTENHPPVFFMTNSGEVNPHAAAILHKDIDSYIVTNKKGADRAMNVLGQGSSTRILVFGDTELDEAAALRSLRSDLGIRMLLHEGGRGAVASLVHKGLIDQLFLTQMTMSPQGNLDASNVQYLFETGDHQPPASLRKITTREDASGKAHLHNFDARSNQSF